MGPAKYFSDKWTVGQTHVALALFVAALAAGALEEHRSW